MAIRTSLRMVGQGIIPKTWEFDDALTAKANDALYFCRDRINAQTKVRVFRSQANVPTWGRCWRKPGIIVLYPKGHASLDTLAHEVAHMAYGRHGKRHRDMTEKICRFWRVPLLDYQFDFVQPKHRHVWELQAHCFNVQLNSGGMDLYRCAKCKNSKFERCKCDPH